MRIISRKRLNEFAAVHSDAKPAPERWYRLAKNRDFSNFPNLRETFPSADQVGKFTVFNIGGNKVSLVAAIHYNRRRIYVRAVLTHHQYDEQRGRNDYAEPRR